MQYSYDEFNRPSAVTSSAMSGSPVQSYSYDTLGRTQSISSTYNSANSQSKITSNYSYVTGAGGQTGRVSSVEYVKTTANGSTALLPTTSYTYDLNGNITHIHEGGVLKAHYYYDGLNRLAREDNGYIGKTIVYEYNSGGDILSRTEYALTNSETLGEAVNVIEYRYDDLNHLNGVTLYDETDIIGYDTLGTPTVYRDYQLAWEKGNRLTMMNSAENSLLFGYDASGLRTWRIVNEDYTEYTYIGTTLVSQDTDGEIINFSYTASGAPYGFTLNGTSYFYLLNLQGDIIGIYDSNGNIVVQYVYDSWGKLISITGSLADTVGVKNPLRYRGYYYDTLSGLYYLQSRYYDPETGRFISSDTLLIAGNDTIQGTNLFAYCYNNPVMYVDPTGQMTTEEVIYFSTGLIGGMLFLEKYLPLMNLDHFMRDIADANLSGMEVTQTILSLCMLIEDGYEGSAGDLFVMATKNMPNKKGTDGWKPRIDKKHGSQNRQKSGSRERNVGHPESEEHSRRAKGNRTGVKKKSIKNAIVVGGLAWTLANNFTGIGISDDWLIPILITSMAS